MLQLEIRLPLSLLFLRRRVKTQQNERKDEEKSQKRNKKRTNRVSIKVFPCPGQVFFFSAVL